MLFTEYTFLILLLILEESLLLSTGMKKAIMNVIDWKNTLILLLIIEESLLLSTGMEKTIMNPIHQIHISNLTLNLRRVSATVYCYGEGHNKSYSLITHSYS